MQYRIRKYDFLQPITIEMLARTRNFLDVLAKDFLSSTRQLQAKLLTEGYLCSPATWSIKDIDGSLFVSDTIWLKVRQFARYYGKKKCLLPEAKHDFQKILERYLITGLGLDVLMLRLSLLTDHLKENQISPDVLLKTAWDFLAGQNAKIEAGGRFTHDIGYNW
uniref:Uncharacterized protein n=1 Tax=viral metagenome TaxID=1070528 RepID=A0A6M3IF01_9ZZZZ